MAQSKRMLVRRLATVGLVGLLVVAFFSRGLQHDLTLGYLHAEYAHLAHLLEVRPLLTGGGYVLLYVLVASLSLPGAAVLTMAGGALFGLLWGTLLASLGSSLGAAVAFLVARFVLHDAVQGRFSRSLRAINRGIRRDGPFYLFTLRLVPVFPYFIVNLAMAVTPIRLWTFFWVSLLGMLPGTLVFVNAGTQLSRVHALADVLSPGLIGAFTLLGLFPLVARKSLAVFRRRRALRGYPKPRRFDRNLVVIGGGSAGLVAAYIAATVRAGVTLVEQDRMGGDCLNTGCVPSKALIRSARVAHLATRASEFGFAAIRTEFEFADVMQRVERVIRTIEPHDSDDRYRALGVDVLHGAARITSPWSVRVGQREITTRAIVVAAGARPLVPPIPGLDGVQYLTSDSVWGLRERPGELLIIGGGPIGCELAQAFARLGCNVTLVEMASRLLVREDPDVADSIAEVLRGEGVRLALGCSASAIRSRDGTGGTLVCDASGEVMEFEFDRLLLALGRRANVEGYGLEELGGRLAPDGTLEVDRFLRTSIPTIYACGDVTGPYQFTHTASHQAWYATVNALFGGIKRFKVDYSVIPWATFTDPEIARVGLNETQAGERGIPYQVTTFSLSELDRAIIEGSTRGTIKVLTVPGRDRILGATIVAEHAGELVAEFVLAMRHGLGLNKLLSTIHVYPTLMEANRSVAGAWRRNHVSPRTLRWLGGWHAWRRSGAAGLFGSDPP